jgi:hypothetical protein
MSTTGRGRARSTSPFVAPEMKTSPAEAVAKALEIPLEDLSFVGTSTLEKAFDELHLSAAERAAVEVKILKSKRGGALEQHFEAETAQKLYPWKVQQEEATRLLADLTTVADGADDDENLRLEYLRKAKNGTLDVFDVVVGSFLLFNTGVDSKTARHQFLALMLRVPPPRRMAVYNWWVASSLPATTVTTHGASIVSLTSPMFPNHPSLTQLNERLWNTQNGTLQGSGGTQLYAGDGPLWGGAPNIPVINGPDGPYVDCAMIQEVTLSLGRSLTEQQQQLQQQQQLLGKLLNRPTQRQQIATTHQPQYNRQQYNYARGGHNGGYNGRGGYNDGGYNGRGGRRRRFHGGEAPEEEPPKNE